MCGRTNSDADFDRRPLRVSACRDGGPVLKNDDAERTAGHDDLQWPQEHV
jgi:hypothetical protein